MAVIEWDKVGERTFETGVDRGVLYLSNGSAVPWNGLTAVSDKSEREVTSVHFDGRKINDLITPESFAGTIKALTYPNEMSELEGMLPAAPGMFLGHQSPKSFGLSWRTQVGNDLNQDAGYKIHLLYNAFVVPSDKDYESVQENISPMEFEWDISATPEEVPMHRPTAYVVIDSRSVKPEILAEIEDLLYGTEVTDAALVSMATIFAYLDAHFVYKVIDNGDGTWTVYSPDPIPVVDGEFTLTGINGSVVGGEYEISTTYVAGYEP